MRHILTHFCQSIERIGIHNTVQYYCDSLQRRVAQRRYLREQRRAEELEKDKVRICFEVSGGFGDYLIFANYLYYFRNRFCSDYDIIDIYFPMGIGGASHIFYEECHVNLIQKNCCVCKKDYELYIRLSRFPQVIRYCEAVIKKIHPELMEYIAMCKAFEVKHREFFLFSPYLDGKTADYCIGRKQIRLQQPDIYGMLGITQEYRFPLKIELDEVQFLKKWDLKPDTYITIHRGCDVRYSDSTKLWGKENYNVLARRIKKKYPAVKIVQCGVNSECFPEVADADLNLVGKTTLEEVKVLLKNSLLHIDNEGGLVHLRHAICGKTSIVLFGPTSDRFYGYGENVNIRSRCCTLPCEWRKSDWSYNCYKGNKPECMELIDVENITIEVDKILVD